MAYFDTTITTYMANLNPQITTSDDNFNKEVWSRLDLGRGTVTQISYSNSPEKNAWINSVVSSVSFEKIIVIDTEQTMRL